MAKHFKTLIVMLLLCLCSTGWSQTTFNFTTGEWKFPLTKSSYTISGEKGKNTTLSPIYNTNDKDVRFYAKNIMTVTNANCKISKIVFHMSKRGKERWGTLNTSCGNTVVDTENGTTTWEYAEGTESVNFTVSDNNDYGSEGKNQNGMFCFNKVEIYRSDIQLANVSFGISTNKTYTFKDGTLGGFATPKASEENRYEGNVVYSSSDANVVTVDKSTGNINIAGNGKADITATFVPDDPDICLTASDKYTIVNRKKTEAGSVVFSSGDKSFDALSKNYKNGDFALIASDGKSYTFNTTNAAYTTTFQLKLKQSSITSPKFPFFQNGYTVKVTYSTGSGSITLKSGSKETKGTKTGTNATSEVSITTNSSDQFIISTGNDDNVVYISKIEITTDTPSAIELDELYANGIIARDNISVTLKRTMVANEWNTVCLPFAVTVEQAKTAFGEGVKIAALNPDAATAPNVLSFKYVGAMEAGKPYIIKPTKESPVDGYTFEGVKTTDGAPSVVKTQDGIGFVGIYNPVDITDDVQTNSALSDTKCFAAFLGDSDRLYKASDKSTTKGFRAYFAIPENTSPAMYIAIDGSTTSINDIHTDCESDTPTYNLQGQRVNSNCNRGIYIKKGKKYIVR